MQVLLRNNILKVRLKWLRGRVDEDDGESDGETAALRESLQV